MSYYINEGHTYAADPFGLFYYNKFEGDTTLK